MSDLLLVIDGNSLVHRAFHAMPPLTTSRGELVNAVFAVAQMLLKAFGELRPRYAVAAFHTAAPTFRNEAYAHYKGTRGPATVGLHEQFRRVYYQLCAPGPHRLRPACCWPY